MTDIIMPPLDSDFYKCPGWVVDEDCDAYAIGHLDRNRARAKRDDCLVEDCTGWYCGKGEADD